MDVIGYQRWDSLLFLHWRVPPDLLSPLIPDRLWLDTFDGSAFVSLTPFTVAGARPILIPAIPKFSTFHEVNARTYVRLEGRDPGIWFFSLDAANPIAALMARVFPRLPYFFARIQRYQSGPEFHYVCQRHAVGGYPKACLAASWKTSADVFQAQPGTLEYFLVERYVLFSRAVGRTFWRGQVRHTPWPLQPVVELKVEQTIDRADGLPGLTGNIMAHYSAGVEAEFLPFRLV